MKSMYIDAEWYIGGKIFLIGMTSRADRCTMLYGEKLTVERFMRELRGVTHIFIFGPDMRVIETFFGIRLKHRYICINLIRIFNRLHPLMPRRKLIDYEEMYGIQRTTRHLKGDVYSLLKLWESKEGRKLMLRYNAEDVQNLARLKRLVWAKHKPSIKWVNQHRL